MSALSVDKLVQHDIAYEYENVLVERSKHHSMLWGLLVDYVKRQNIQICDITISMDHDHIVHLDHICT